MRKLILSIFTFIILFNSSFCFAITDNEFSEWKARTLETIIYNASVKYPDDFYLRKMEIDRQLLAVIEIVKMQGIAK